MKVNLNCMGASVIGKGSLLFHVTVYAPENAHGSMFLVAGESLARAVYTAWGVVRAGETLDLTQCDGYLIGEFE